MAPFGIFKKTLVLGLDLGSSSLKLAVFTQGEKGLALKRTEVKELPPGADSASQKKARISALKALMAGLDLKNSRLYVSFNHLHSATRLLTTPVMPMAELREAVRLEAKQYFNLPIEESSFDYEVLGAIEENGIKKLHIAAAIMPRIAVDETLQILTQCGLKPDALVPIPVALRHGALDDHGTMCIIEIGAEITECVILKGKQLLLSRKIPVSGKTFTSVMTGVLATDQGKVELSFDEAEGIKKQTGIPDSASGEIIKGKLKSVQLNAMFTGPLEQLATEIDRCLHYYSDEMGGGKLERLLLCGGGSLLKGLPEFLSSELGIKVEKGERFATALGTGRSEGKGINLMPPELKEKTQRTIKRAVLETTVVSVVVVLALLYTGIQIQLGNYSKRIEAGQSEYGALQHDLKKMDEQRIVNKLMNNQPYWEDVLKELSNIIPGEMYLEEITMDRDKIYFVGIVFGDEKEKSCSNLMRTMEEGIFKNVTLVSSQEMPGGLSSEIELRAEVD